MAVSTGSEISVRVLGLGNEILADDAFGIVVAREVERRCGDRAEVVASSEAGFHLLDRLVGVDRLVVVDTILSGTARPGTLRVWTAAIPRSVPLLSPHVTGIFEVLALARKLNMRTPREVTILGVEAADCFTVGGPMHPDVRAAIPEAVNQCVTLVHSG
ncbi:MAG TPA: hydrogenase maturation protease [Bryobacteraceae bacterium]|nr:hydrogenase maturation protease [Bryobacteraceae bacterium]